MAEFFKRFRCRFFGCKTEVLHTHKVELEHSPYTYTVVRCVRCGAVQLEES